MGKQDEFLWDETPMGEKVEEEVAEFLRKRNSQYMWIKAAQKKILEEYPAILKIFYAEEEEVNLTVTEHKKLIEHLNLEDQAERMERKYCFFLGQARMFSYGRMLAEIQDTVRKRDIDDEINEELLDYVMDGRSDDVEMGLQAENLEYREALNEVTFQENMIQAMGLTKPVKKQVDAYVSAVNRRWILYVEQNAQSETRGSGTIRSKKPDVLAGK